MRFIRNFFRLLKYRIKFLNKNDSADINYFVQSRFLDKKLTNLMTYYGSDKGGLKKIIILAIIIQLFFLTKEKILKIY